MKKTLSRLPRIVRLAALSAVLLALCSKSSPLYAFNDWMDANIFFTMGRSMLGGRVLYRDVFDHKGPVLYLLYGLAGLVGGTDFRGVLVLEIIAMTSFLYTGLRTAELLAGRRLSVWWMALPAAGMAASRAFSHGGSAEELLLPFLAAALFSLVRALHSPGTKPLRAVCVQGLLAGCALWLKYTVLGFYLAWVVVLAALYLRRGWLAQLGRSTLQRGDLVLVLLQQAVDRRNIVVDLLDGTAAAFATARHRNQVFTGLYQHQVLRNRIDVLENGIYQRIFGADDRNERVPLVFDPDDRPFAHAGCEGECRTQRHDRNVLHNFLKFKLLFAFREANINIKTIPCSKIFPAPGKSALSVPEHPGTKGSATAKTKAAPSGTAFILQGGKSYFAPFLS